jgi:hypothetical protein
MTIVLLAIPRAHVQDILLARAYLNMRPTVQRVMRERA